jgi:hypothetical protein
MKTQRFAGCIKFRLALLMGFCQGLLLALLAQEPCKVVFPTVSLSIPHVGSDVELNIDPHYRAWGKVASAWIFKDCTRPLDYPDLKSEVTGFWTDSHLYLLFMCPYRALTLFLPPAKNRDRDKLWEKDVVEMFLGDDWKNIRHYREFEIAPTGDWIDLAINLDQKSYDHTWNSGWETQARIDERAHVWYAAAKIPLNSVSTAKVQPGTRWRMNLYRIDGAGPDSQRRFLCWQPTCVVNRDPNHVPEAFGSLVFDK